MWRTSSILFQVSILFAFAFASFLTISLFYVKIQLDLESITQYNNIVNAIGKMKQFNASMNEIKWYLEEQGFHEITPNESFKKKIMESNQEPMLGSLNVNITQEGSNIFITLQTTKRFIVYQDSVDFVWTQYHTVIVLGSIVLVLVYIALISHLMPISNIKHELMNMTQNQNLQKITCAANHQDEIGDLVREFNYIVDKLQSIEKSRMLFLRSIMHELKTPITKGRIVVETLQDAKQQARLCNVFERLNNLIDEFAKIEELASKNYNVCKKEFLLIDVINEAKAMLLVDKNMQERIVLHHNNDLIKADFDLFALIVKNLIDNGLKYSIDSQVEIDVTKQDLIIKNKSKPLALDINEYFKPYFKDVKNPLSQGFGLGMYIVKSALDAQNLNLCYQYEEGYNMFIIQNCIVESFCNLPKYYNPTRQRLNQLQPQTESPNAHV
ncbi:ArsS family sensor histidine kinase [Helicobacter aurati]|uniref:ArsS family sensor histidine kinase n=1 Tax=Helicobacter aurati TaxID=137778 RepID=UPI0015F1BFD8|nr:ArsS family sensor histidine kinase [Helicobacter aurati]